MIEVIRETDRDLEVDVLALQALSSPSELLGTELAALGGNTCAGVSGVVGCCTFNSNCIVGGFTQKA